MTTNMFAAKRALFTGLAELAGRDGSALTGVQVAYSWPGSTVERRCVYGGGTTFDQPGDNDAVDGTRRLVAETAHLALHIRVVRTPPGEGGIEDADAEAEAIGEAIGAWIAANPRFAGGSSRARMVGGQGDYFGTDDAATSTLSYRIDVDSYLDPLEL